MHPILFSRGSFTIYSYGFCVALAMVLSLFLVRRLARRGPYSARAATDLVFLAFVGGILGARLFYVGQHWADYEGRLLSVFFLQEGGLVWYGGFLGAVLAVILAALSRGESALVWADLFSPVLALGHAVGRVGCFLNGCCFGKAGHPVQFYESFCLALLSVFLFARFFQKRRTGVLFGSYLLGYGLIRFFLEFLRGDQQPFAGFTIPQWISLGSIAAGAWILSGLGRKNAG